MKKALYRFIDSESTFSVSVPSKLMLIGEYAVLAGSSALVTTLKPRFRMTVRRSASRWATSATHSFHPESAASKLIAELARDEKIGIGDEITFEDPHLGKGGFGGSTAEFALSYAALTNDADVQALWRRYRKLHSDASGADLVAQWLGGTILFSYDGDSLKTEIYAQDSKTRSVLDRIQVFTATHQDGRKLNTALHLQSDETVQAIKSVSEIRETLDRIIAAAVDALGSGDANAFGESLTAYALALSNLNLEVSASRLDREAFMSLRGVLGCKGVGAGLSDTMIVLTDGLDQSRSAVSQIARERNLIEVEVANGFGIEAGVSS